MLLGSIGLMDSSDSVCRISASGHACESAFYPSRSFHLKPLPLSEPLQRLHIGANDITNPAGFGVAVDFVDIGPLLAKTILEGFDCDIESDFVPELKTVGDSFRS